MLTVLLSIWQRVNPYIFKDILDLDLGHAVLFHKFWRVIALNRISYPQGALAWSPFILHPVCNGWGDVALRRTPCAEKVEVCGLRLPLLISFFFQLSIL
jgi:hypothetical protein